MFTKLVVVLTEQERAALQKLSERELRSQRDQLRFLLRRDLKRRGLLREQQALERMGDGQADT